MTHRTLLYLTGTVLLSATVVACGGGDAEMSDTMTMTPPATVAPAPAADDPAMGGALVANVDSVLTAANASGGLTGIAPSVAVPIIQRIEDMLDATDNEQLDSVSDDLERLREQLGASTFDGAAVGTTLASLADKVNAYAPTAPAAVQGPLQQLGTALTDAAQRVRQ